MHCGNTGDFLLQVFSGQLYTRDFLVSSVNLPASSADRSKVIGFYSIAGYVLHGRMPWMHLRNYLLFLPQVLELLERLVLL